ncbi:hypothetical protein FA95DRAFT_1561436 [Auriscalpium vulgare]|uniref:Uncharacterized protein n=1 Tax=Auriscalpium vulgare TaxID=40419 RepID=A0ACB8RMM1_9AGAM|nr:hypothetical protein FA95DRAFT_1561436 [Auriscalpium vulgare]
MGKNNVQDLLNNADIQDPFDFSQKILQDLDSAVRCKICSELYAAPVVLACGHCFCSLCARSQLSEKEACPACWKPATEDQLRINPAMEEAVIAWKAARAFVVRLATDDHIRQMRPQTPELRPTKKRRMSPASDSDIEMLEQPAAGPSTPRKPTKRPSSPAQPRPKSTARSRSSEPPVDDKLIDCPACAHRVHMDKINQHLDSGCKLPPSTVTTSAKQKDAWSKIFSGETRKKGKDRTGDDAPLPKVSYAVLKEKQIRELLAEHDLPTTGERSLLIARHQRWITLYNANLDHHPSQRRRTAELRTELRKWEDDRKAITKRGTAKEVAQAVNLTQHQRDNKAEFAVLVARARPKKATVAVSTSSGLAELDADGCSSPPVDKEHDLDASDTQVDMTIVDPDAPRPKESAILVE